jgi:hypothetical protein
MFDAPVDAWYGWVGTALVSAALLGVAVDLPSRPPPDAAGLADTVDAVAASPHAATAAHPVRARRIRVGPRRVALRGPGGTSHATFSYPVVPVPPDDGPLRRVLHGAPPDRAFGSPARLRRAAERARETDPDYRPVGDRLLVRRVTWEDTRVTLVG